MKPYPPELRAEARRIADEEGIGYRRISRRIGVPGTTVDRWIRPDYHEKQLRGAREAKRRRTGNCENCGAETRYNGHTAPVSRLCHRCACVSSGAEKRGDGFRQQQLAQLLRERGSVRFSEIRDALGISSSHVSVLVTRAMRYGFIRRVSRGVYKLA